MLFPLGQKDIVGRTPESGRAPYFESEVPNGVNIPKMIRRPAVVPVQYNEVPGQFRCSFRILQEHISPNDRGFSEGMHYLAHPGHIIHKKLRQALFRYFCGAPAASSQKARFIGPDMNVFRSMQFSNFAEDAFENICTRIFF